MFVRSIIQEITQLLSLSVHDTKWSMCIFSSTDCLVFNPSTLLEKQQEFKSILLHHLTLQANRKSLPSHHILLQDFDFTESISCNSWSEKEFTCVLFTEKSSSIQEIKWIELIRNCFENCLIRRELSTFLQVKNNRIDQLIIETNQLKENHGKLICDYLERRSEIENIRISASDSFLNNESITALSLRQLDEIIRKRLLQNQFIFSTEAIVIDVEDLICFVSEQPTPVRTSTQDRTEILLNRYEQSAQRAKEMGIEINGKTIAELMIPSVSPPAVSDALKKNRKTIAELLRNYPEKWPLIRAKLKPLQYLNSTSIY